VVCGQQSRHELAIVLRTISARVKLIFITLIAAVQVRSAAADVIEEAKAALLDTLRDPDSAKFFFMVKRKKDIVCGWVDAKADDGSYAGKRMWMYSIGKKFIYVDNDYGPDIIMPQSAAMVVRPKRYLRLNWSQPRLLEMRPSFHPLFANLLCGLNPDSLSSALPR